MAKYDIYQIDNSNILLLEVQADTLRDLRSTVVVPLLPIKRLKMGRLTPFFNIGGSDYLMDTPQISSIMRRDLGNIIDRLGSKYEIDVTAALDLLLSGR